MKRPTRWMDGLLMGELEVIIFLLFVWWVLWFTFGSMGWAIYTGEITF